MMTADLHKTAPLPGASFGLGALLLVCGLVAACLALARVDQLAGMIATGVCAAALFRTQRIVNGLLANGESPGNGFKLLVFLSSLAAVLTALVATLAGAGLIGFTGWLAGHMLLRFFAEPWIPAASLSWGLVSGIPAGLIAAERLTAGWWNPAQAE